MTLGALGRGVGLDPTPVQNRLMWPNLPHLKQATLVERRRLSLHEFTISVSAPYVDGTIRPPCVSGLTLPCATCSRDSSIPWTVLETTHSRSRSAKQRGRSTNTKRDGSWGVTPSKIILTISFSGNPNLKIRALLRISCTKSPNASPLACAR